MDFLDLTLRIEDGCILSSLFEKRLNLYLYLPPVSCHPPGVLKGLITGMVIQIHCLVSDENEREGNIKDLFCCLAACIMGIFLLSEACRGLYHWGNWLAFGPFATNLDYFVHTVESRGSYLNPSFRQVSADIGFSGVSTRS